MKELARKQFHETVTELVNPKHTAVIVVDVQNDVCSPDGYYGRLGKDVSMLQYVRPALSALLEGAREAGALIIFTQLTTLEGGRSDSAAWLRRQQKVGKAPRFVIEGTWGHEFIPSLQPQPGEPIVPKHRASAFVNTSLDTVLRANGIETIIIAGGVTHACIMATAMHAASMDYYVVIAEGCVASYSVELHEAAMKIMSVAFDLVNHTDIIKQWISLRSATASS